MTDLKISTAKKLDLICEKVLQRIEKRVLDDSRDFYGCKTVEGALLELGSKAWGDILYEVGYSTRYCVEEVHNLTPRFCKLLDKVVARFDKETKEKIIKMTLIYNVIARCADGDVMISKDGINEFDWDEAKEIADAHKTLGAEIIIVNAN